MGIKILLTTKQQKQLAAIATAHSMTLQDYVQELVNRDIRMMAAFEERHPHLFKGDK